MANSVYVLGGGGHARVVLDALLANGVAVTGVLDPALPPGDAVLGVPIKGGDELLEGANPDAVLLVNGIGANPDVVTRKRLFEEMRAGGFAFASVRHPSATIGRECELGEGVQVMAGAVLQAGVRIGDNTVVNTSASVDHDCMIGAHVFVSPGAVLCGDVTVGECTFIGAGAVVLPGVSIGVNAIVGAGSVVREAVAAGCIVAGNPAVRIGG